MAIEDPDPEFLSKLIDLAGTGEEVQFERTGDGYSTYTFHGQIEAVDRAAGTVSIRRSRTHQGQLHTMGVRYFLSATLDTGTKISNSAASTFVFSHQAWAEDRNRLLERVRESSHIRPCTGSLRTRYLGIGQGNYPGLPAERFVIGSRESAGRTVGLIAKSEGSLARFIAAQDAFMPLDEIMPLAFDAHVLWPAGMAFDRGENPESWHAPWPQIYKTLDGIPAKSLRFFLEKLRSGRTELHTVGLLDPDDEKALIKYGLISIEPPPAKPDDVIPRLAYLSKLKLVKSTGVKPAGQTNEALAEQLRTLMTPQLYNSARALIKPPRVFFQGPCGLAVEEFAEAVKELRNSVFLMRQWLYETREFWREDELAKLAPGT